MREAIEGDGDGQGAMEMGMGMRMEMELGTGGWSCGSGGQTLSGMWKELLRKFRPTKSTRATLGDFLIRYFMHLFNYLNMVE